MNKCLLVALTLITLLACNTKKQQKVKILQLNLWMQATNVQNGQQGVVEIIQQVDPDLVLLCELTPNSNFTDWLVSELDKHGEKYFNDKFNAAVGVISKYELGQSQLLVHTTDSGRPLVKTHIKVNGQNITVYSAHLDHRFYAPYLTRGYSDEHWNKMEQPITDVGAILAAGRLSLRDEAVKKFIEDAKNEIEQGNVVILGGDFNEPSHLDWNENTKNIRDHGGAVVPWDVSIMLHNAGFVDAYRYVYPDPVSHPGFTYPAGNVNADINKLHFATEADERDRIDFIYVYPQKNVTIVDANIVGPKESVRCGKIEAEDSDDNFLTPNTIWVSDHKGNLVTIRIDD
jgi:endonuclease/exonuclease/phosphatase family metal-dependent hydrolase